MKPLDYKTIKACYDAQQLLKQYPDINPVKQGDRTYSLANGYYGYKAQVTYSQQETIIHPSQEYRSQLVSRVTRLYPDGVDRVFYHRPDKEYVTFNDAAGVKRYYIVPTQGLRIQRDGSGYKAMNAVPDYHIEVGRAMAREARKPAEDLYTYINLLWDMLPAPAYNDRPTNVRALLPAVDDRDAWHDYVNAAKYAKYGSLSKDTVLQRIRTAYTEEALAYNVTQVPDTRTDHTQHWDKLDELRRAGRLEIYEGKSKQKRQIQDIDSGLTF